MGSRDSAKEVARRCNMPHAQMGWFHDEGPRHEVTLAAFYMSIHEVTQGQYAAVVDPTGNDAGVGVVRALDQPSASSPSRYQLMVSSWTPNWMASS